MKRSAIALLSLALLAGGAEPGRAEDELSTKRRSALERRRPRKEALPPRLGRDSNRDETDDEEWKHVDDLRAVGKRGGRGGGRDDDEGSDE
jgi:hypothetical protein